MIENTFCHVPGIGEITEQQLWAAGIMDWGSFNRLEKLPLSRAKITCIRNEIRISQDALGSCKPGYFYHRLKSGQHWRLFKDFRYRVAYIDIETTGLGFFEDYITTVSLYDGRRIRYYVHGDNLDRFIEDIFEYDLLVTYNGKCFDIPFIERYFRTPLPHSHIDLRFVLSSLGYKGGLKRCEQHFGLSRDALDGVDGYFAVILWQEYLATGNCRALETLLAYNIEDVVNLEFLMHQAFNLKVANMPFADQMTLDIPLRPDVPYCADLALVEQLRNRMAMSGFGGWGHR